MKDSTLIAIILVGFIAILMAIAEVEAAEPTIEDYNKLGQYAQQCTLERAEANAAAIAIQAQVLMTCQEGGTFQARDPQGNIHKFFCSEVTTL